MPKFEFTKDFDFLPHGNGMVSIAYKAGQTLPVTTECAKQAKAKKRGKMVADTNEDNAGGSREA